MPTNKTKPFILSTRFLIAVGVAAFIVWGIASLADMNWGVIKLGSEKTITVTGTSKSQQKNQIATFNATITASNADKEAAYNEANERMSKLTDSIKTFGIKDEDLKTTYINVYQQEEPYLENGIQKYKPTTWKASISLEVKLRDVSKSEELTSLLTSQEAGDLYGPNFMTDDSMTDESALLVKAIEDAKTKASKLAAFQGMRIKSVVNIVEGDAAIYNPVYGFGKGMGGGAAEASLSAGTSEVSKSVTVTYTIE